MKQYIFAFIALLIISCSGSKKTAETYVAEPIEYRELDTLVVTDTPVSTEEADSIENSLPVYRASYERTIDIRHTTLELRFDWEKESVIGKADITFKPYFYEVDSFELDAKGFEIGSVVCGDSKENIDFSYDGEKLLVHLPHSLQQDQERTISINYIAHPGKNSSYTFPIAFNRIRKERYRSTISLTREKTPPEEVQLSLPIKVYFSSMLTAQKINHNKYGPKAKRNTTQTGFPP